jgi:hypothetical protein
MRYSKLLSQPLTHICWYLANSSLNFSIEFGFISLNLSSTDSAVCLSSNQKIISLPTPICILKAQYENMYLYKDTSVISETGKETLYKYYRHDLPIISGKLFKTSTIIFNMINKGDKLNVPVKSI